MMRFNPPSAFWMAIKNLILLGYSLFIKVNVTCSGRVAPPLRRAFVVVANHVTGVDSAVIQIALRTRLFFLTWRRWFSNRIGGFFMRNVCDCLPVDCRSPLATVRGIRDALRLLKAGRSIGVYPAGRLDRDGGLGAVKDGASWLSARSGVPLLPVCVRNLRLGPVPYSRPWLNEAWEGFFSFAANLFNRRIEVVVGEPVLPRVVGGSGSDLDAEVGRLNEALRVQLERLSGSAV